MQATTGNVYKIGSSNYLSRRGRQKYECKERSVGRGADHIQHDTTRAGTSPTRGLASPGLAGTRGLASPVEELLSFKTSPSLSILAQ